MQTVLGSVLGVAAAAVLRNRAASRHLETAITEVEEATGLLRREPGDRTALSRRLALLIATMREAYEVASGEPGLDPNVTERVLRAEEAARSALTVRS